MGNMGKIDKMWNEQTSEQVNQPTVNTHATPINEAMPINEANVTVNLLRVLSKVNDLPINTKNVTKKITGGDVFKYKEPGNVGVEKTLKQLLAYGWIAKDDGYAILPYLSVATLKEILDYQKLNKTGLKPELISRIKGRINPEYITNFTDKEIFVITPAGKEVMGHFKHFYWAETHRYLLPYDRYDGRNLDSSYFMKHPDVVPYDYLLQYFDKEPDKLSSLYTHSERYEEAFFQKLTHVTYKLWTVLEKCRVGDELSYLEIHGWEVSNGWEVSTGNGQSSKLNSLYNQANITDEALDNYLQMLFETLDQEQLVERLKMPKPLAKLDYITIDQYKTIMTMMCKGDMLQSKEYLDTLSADIREANWYPRDEAQQARFSSGDWLDEETYREQFPKYEPPTLEEYIDYVLHTLPIPPMDDEEISEDDLEDEKPDATNVEVICKMIETFEKDEIQQIIKHLEGFL